MFGDEKWKSSISSFSGEVSAAFVLSEVESSGVVSVWSDGASTVVSELVVSSDDSVVSVVVVVISVVVMSVVVVSVALPTISGYIIAYSFWCEATDITKTTIKTVTASAAIRISVTRRLLFLMFSALSRNVGFGAFIASEQTYDRSF